MSALLDVLDRFSHSSSSIRSLIQSQLPSREPDPFTAAVLQISTQDLLRDADEAEYGLFTIVNGSDASFEKLATQGEVGKREFKGATPLRGERGGIGKSRDEEPEVYVEAALKYLDRFDVVKPMPEARARLESLIDRLNDARDNIDKTQASLQEIAQHEPPSPKSLRAEEERRINELKSRILQLRKRKEALTSNGPAKSKTQVRPSKREPPSKVPKAAASRKSIESSSSVTSTPSSKPVSPKSTKVPTKHGRQQNQSQRNPTNLRPSENLGQSEGLFWSGGTPLKLGGLPNQSNSLLDEKLDMSTMDPLMSPTPQMPGPSRPLPSSNDPGGNGKPRGIVDEENPGLGDDRTEDDEDDDSGDPTVVVSKITAQQRTSIPPSPPSSAPPSRPPSQIARPELRTPDQVNKTVSEPPSTKRKEKRVRITAEVERICANIWSAIPELLVPGNNFSSPGQKPPNARDTLAVLRAIAAQPIPGPTSNTMSSPSTHSTLSSLLGIETLGPGAGSLHQIMTAHVLLSLLTAPNNAMPLTKLKAHLASTAAVPSPGPEAPREAKQTAAALDAVSAQAGTRALYGCVAKKLVKIDRKGGEQVVKFD